MQRGVRSFICLLAICSFLGAAPQRKADLHANFHHAWLYVAGYRSNTIIIYDLDRLGTPAIGRITSGIDGPCGLTLDPQGNLYVANALGGNVAIYPPLATQPSIVMWGHLTTPVSTAVNSKGDVYVTNRSTTAPSIVVFPAGSTAPSAVISNGLITDIIGEVFDPSDNLFFSDYSMGVSEVPNGSMTPQSLGLVGISHANGIAVDPVTHDIFLGNGNWLGMSILVYAPGNPNPIRTLPGSYAAFSLGDGRLAAHELIFVPDALTETVVVFRDHGRQPRAAIRLPGINNACGVAFKPANQP
jgi:hypothetical protein